MPSTIEQAKNTCDGLFGLIRRLNGAAVDLDKGGESAHELLALLAATSDCVSNLSTQLNSIQTESNKDHATSNVSTLNPNTRNIRQSDEPYLDSIRPEPIRTAVRR